MSLLERLGWLSEWFMMSIGLTTCICIIYLGIVGLSGHSVLGVLALGLYDHTAPVSCDSHSMGSVVSCNDTLLLARVKSTDRLILGSLYIYHNPVTNNSVVHRFVACTNSSCGELVFHGDANTVAELVQRSWIDYQVVGVYYAVH